MNNEQKQDQYTDGEAGGAKRVDNKLVWIVIAVMTVICAAVGVISSVLTGYFMRRGQTLPAINIGEDIQQNIAAVVAVRKPAVAEISCGGLRGSGIAMKCEKGKVYVLTNAHVIETSKSPSVRFAGDDSYYAGEVLGYNTFYDVAVITVVHDEVYVLSEEYISPTTDYHEGDYVVAIGNAMGMGIASYDGIISRAYEVLTYKSKQVPVMRTTAAINAGMSGGALFDMSGNLIGLDTYRMSSTTERDEQWGSDDSNNSHNASEDVEDTGFVVPISIVYPIYKQILQYNSDGGPVNVIDMRYFATTYTSNIGGISFIDLGFTGEYRGGKLTVTSKDSDYAPSNLAVGDVITAIGTYEVTPDLCRTAGEFLRYRKNAFTGSMLRLTVSRDDQTFSVEYTNIFKYVS